MVYYYVCDGCKKIMHDEETNALIGSKASRWLCDKCMKKVLKEAKRERKESHKGHADKQV